MRSLSVPNARSANVRPAIFAGAIGTNLDDPGTRHVVSNLGGQIDVRFGVLSVLDLTLSAGGAIAVETGQAPRREAMISLKILK